MTQLALRRTWPDDPHTPQDFEVVVAGQQKGLARIFFEKSRYPGIWTWSVYGFNVGQTDNMRGSAATFEEAKALTKACVFELLAANTPLMHEPASWRPGSAFQLLNSGKV